MRRFFALLALVAACKAPPAPQEIASTLAPYDFRGQTPAKLAALTGPEASPAERFAAARARLDWLLLAWLTEDHALLGALGDHVGRPRCSQREEFEPCISELAKRTRDALGEPDVSAPDTEALATLLGAVSAGPRSAAQAAGLASAVKRAGPLRDRAQLALLASARSRLRAQPAPHRENALLTLVESSPFACPERFLSARLQSSEQAAHGLASLCALSCPAHQDPSHKDAAALVAACSLSYYGLAPGQERFVSERNFLLQRALAPLATALNEVSALAPQDPLAPLIAPALDAFARDLAALRLPAGLPALPPLPARGQPESPAQPMYLYVTPEAASLALWPTISLAGPPSQRAVALREGDFLHPGRPLGPLAEAAPRLSDALRAAEDQDRALGPRLGPPAPASAPDQAPSSAPAPVLPLPYEAEGTRDPGSPLYVVADPSLTVGALWPLLLAAQAAGKGELHLVTDTRGAPHLSTLRAVIARSEDLAVLDRAPRGFPGGALIVSVQPEAVQTLFQPGFAERGYSPVVVPRSPGALSRESLSPLWESLLPERVIVAIAPSTTVGDLAILLGGLVDLHPQVEIALTEAPEQGPPAWLSSLPPAITPRFRPQAPLDPLASPYSPF